MTERTRSPLAVAVLLGVMVVALFYNTLDNKATNWDDPALFSRRAYTAFTLDNVRELLVIHSTATYQPLRDLSYLLDFTLWKDRVVFGMHIQNMALYLIMVLLCYAFLRQLLGAFHDSEDECYIWAATASVLFAVHPVHVESVAWLYARKEPLLGIFTFLSLWAFLKARLVSWKYYVLSALGLIGAIFSKPTALVLPAVMFVLDIALHARLQEPGFWKRRLLLYAPMLAIVIPMMARLVGMMTEVGGVKPYHGGSFWTNLLAVSQILVSYVKLIGFTVNYAADYSLELYTDPRMWQPWLFVALNLGLVAGALWAFVKRHYVFAFFVCWYYVFLLPVSHIFPISQVMADRYALLPSLSWCVLLGYLLARLWHVRIRAGVLTPFFFTALAVGLFCFITLFYAYMTFRQNDVWQDSLRLWTHTVAITPHSSPGNVNLASIYIKQGRFEEAQEHSIIAIKALPYDYLAISNLALSQVMMGQYDNAITNYKTALRIKPDLHQARMGLAYAYWEKGDFRHTYEVYEQLLSKGITGSESHRDMMYYRLGVSAWKTGRPEQARMFLLKAEPGMYKDRFRLSELAGFYTTMRDYRKAYELYSDLAGMLEEGDAREKLDLLLGALRKKLERDAR